MEGVLKGFERRIMAVGQPQVVLQGAMERFCLRFYVEDTIGLYL
jgi:hypothetical protein